MDDFGINVADLAVIAVVVISGIFALVRGLVHEILAVGAWIGAAIATLYGFPRFQPYVRDLITIQWVADIVAGVAIFLVVLILLNIVTHMIARRVRLSNLGALDRSLGLVFGLARGAALVCVAWLALSWAVPRQDYPTWLLEARSLPLVEEGARLLVDLLPNNLRPLSLPGMDDSAAAVSRAFETLVNPAPKGAGPGERSGYKDQERKDLLRLLETSQ